MRLLFVPAASKQACMHANGVKIIIIESSNLPRSGAESWRLSRRLAGPKFGRRAIKELRVKNKTCMRTDLSVSNCCNYH